MIKLNRKFYTKEAIEKAVEAYEEFCSFKIKESQYFEIELFKKTTEDCGDIEREFCNYCLSLMR